MTKKELMEEVEKLEEENRELRKFINYVRWLKTEDDFLNLKVILEQADIYFNSKKEDE